MGLELLVNQTTHQHNVEPDLLLVDFLRDTLNLIGTKLGCDLGVCRTCTVLVDRKTTKSCQLLAVLANPSRKTTSSTFIP